MNGDTGPEGLDPSVPDDAAALQLIVSMRIYDVLITILHKQDPDKANELLELHSTGALLGTAPYFIGEFITDRLNGNSPPKE